MLRGATEGAGGVWKDVAKLSEQDLAALVTAPTMSRHLCSACHCVLPQTPSPLTISLRRCVTMPCLVSCLCNSMTEARGLHSPASLYLISCVHA